MKRIDGRLKGDFKKNAEKVILAKSPNGVIVNDHLEIVHFRGSTGNWIEPAAGKPSLNILKIVKRELAVELRRLVHRAKTTRRNIRKDGIVMQFASSRTLVAIEVIPLLDTIDLYFLILFENTAEISNPEASERDDKVMMTPGGFRLQQLEKELLQAREDMRRITADQEAGNEELLSANEDLLSGSEELRSQNEELKISKEELQSTVEELKVSNQELAFRIDQLSYSRSYSEAIVTTIREPLLVLDQELRIKSANSAFYKAFLYDQLETEGKFFYELDDHLWDIPDLRSMLDRTLADDSCFENFEVKTKSSTLGNRVMILNARRILSIGNNEQLVLVAIEDVTERRRLENNLKKNAEHLRGILELSPQISFATLPDGSIDYYNGYFLNYVGVKLDQAIDSGWQIFVHPDDLALVAKSWDHSVATGEEFYVEVRLKRHDGDYRWHVSRALPTWNSEGKIMSWVGAAYDIHDQKMFAGELEKQVRSRTLLLKQANIELEHSNKNLEQFAFIASHDLQEPLRKIQTFSAMLVDNFKEQIPPNATALVEKIAASSNRMRSLIRDVLNFSSIDKESNAFCATDLKLILKDVIEDFNHLSEGKMARIQIGDLPVVNVIPIQVSQLFYNLVSNALKFTRNEVLPEIKITSRILSSFEVARYSNLDKNSSYLEILFEDNGIGFDQQYGEKIFEIFQRLHSQGHFAGTGIGLALCKKIVAIHEGEIFVESRPGEGTLFHVILPLKDDDVGEELLPATLENALEHNPYFTLASH